MWSMQLHGNCIALGSSALIITRTSAWNCRQMWINLEISVQFSSCSSISVQPSVWEGRRQIKTLVFWNVWDSMEFSCVVVEEVSVDMREEQKLTLNLRGEQKDKHLFFIGSKKCEWDLRGTAGSTLEVTLNETWSTWEENFPSYVSGRQIMHVWWICWWDGEERNAAPWMINGSTEARINSVHTHDYIFLCFSQRYQQIQPETLSLCQLGVRKHKVNQKFPTTNKSANFFELLVCSAVCCWCSLHKHLWDDKGIVLLFSFSKTNSNAITGLDDTSPCKTKWKTPKPICMIL